MAQGSALSESVFSGCCALSGFCAFGVLHCPGYCTLRVLHCQGSALLGVLCSRGSVLGQVDVVFMLLGNEEGEHCELDVFSLREIFCSKEHAEVFGNLAWSSHEAAGLMKSCSSQINQ